MYKLKKITAAAIFITLVGCGGDSSDPDTDTMNSNLGENNFEIFADTLTNPDDSVVVSNGVATFQATANSDENAGIFVSTLPRGESDMISMKVRFSSDSVVVSGGDSRTTIRGSFYNGLANGGMLSANGEVAGDVQLRLSMRNRSDGIRDILACASLTNVDGSTSPATVETEDGDNDGCAGIGWFFDYDTEYEIGIGVDRSTSEIIFFLDDDVRRFSSTFDMFDAEDPRQLISVSSEGDGSKSVVQISEIRTDVFTDTALDQLSTTLDDIGFENITDVSLGTVFDKQLFLFDGEVQTENFIIVRSGGTFDGTWNDSPIAGTWEMREGFWCRVLTEFFNTDSLGVEDCQLWEINGDRIRGTRDRGTGNSFIYNIVG